MRVYIGRAAWLPMAFAGSWLAATASRERMGGGRSNHSPRRARGWTVDVGIAAHPIPRVRVGQSHAWGRGCRSSSALLLQSGSGGGSSRSSTRSMTSMQRQTAALRGRPRDSGPARVDQEAWGVPSPRYAQPLDPARARYPLRSPEAGPAASRTCGLRATRCWSCGRRGCGQTAWTGPPAAAH